MLKLQGRLIATGLGFPEGPVALPDASGGPSGTNVVYPCGWVSPSKNAFCHPIGRLVGSRNPVAPPEGLLGSIVGGRFPPYSGLAYIPSTATEKADMTSWIRSGRWSIAS